jgi:ABC-type transport system involved in cytochrome bd biosynthesis fused ATPase/permease subunit
MITSGLIGGFLLLSFEILNVLLIISLLSFVNWKVTLLVFLSLSLYLLATTSLLARKMSNIGNLQVASGLESRRRMTDVILGWKEIKSFQLENVFSNLFINERGKLGKFLAIGTWNQNLSKYIFEFFLISVASCFVFVSKTTLFQESMDITYLSLLLVAMLRLVPSFMRIQGLTLEISRVTQPSYTLLNDTRSLWEPSSRVPNVRGGPVEE